MDSGFIDQSSFSIPLNESSFTIFKGIDISRKDDEKQLPARNFSSNINAPAGDDFAGTVNNNLFEDDEDDSPAAEPTKKTGKKSKKSTARKPKSQRADAEQAPEKPQPKKKRKQGGKKRPKGKVGHTRGPGIDL